MVIKDMEKVIIAVVVSSVAAEIAYRMAMSIA